MNLEYNKSTVGVIWTVKSSSPVSTGKERRTLKVKETEDRED